MHTIESINHQSEFVQNKRIWRRGVVQLCFGAVSEDGADAAGAVATFVFGFAFASLSVVRVASAATISVALVLLDTVSVAELVLAPLIAGLVLVLAEPVLAPVLSFAVEVALAVVAP